MGKRPSPTGNPGRKPNLRQLGGSPATNLSGIVRTPHGTYLIKKSHGTRRSGEIDAKKERSRKEKVCWLWRQNPAMVITANTFGTSFSCLIYL